MVKLMCLFNVLAIAVGARWFEYQGSCYTMPSLQNITYQTSVSECSALGSYLAELNTLEELSYIQVLANGSNSSFWLGLNFNNGSGRFHWNRAGTEPMTGMWIDGEPNLTGLCVRLTTEVLMGAPTATPKDIYLLADNPCSSLYMSLCEKSADLKKPVYYGRTSACKNCCPLTPLTTARRLDCAWACSRLKECVGFQFTRTSSQCLPLVFNTSCSLSVSLNSVMYTAIQPRC